MYDYPVSQLDRIYDEESANLEAQWRRAHLRIMVILSVGVVTVEALLSLVLRWSRFIKIPFDIYFIRYLVIPWATYTFIDLATFLLYRFSHLRGKTLNYVVSLAFSGMCLAVCFFHDYFVVSFAGGVLAISLTTIYGDRRLTGITTLVMIFCEMLFTLINHWDSDVIRNETYMINVSLVILIELGAYLISFTIAEWEEKRRHAVVIRQAEIEELRRTAERDQLTGVRNRRGLRSYIDEHQVNLIYVMMDIDHFKAVNDKWGHDAGDDVIRKFGRILLLEESDSVAAFRYGGDEFLMVLNGCTREEAREVCDAVRRKFISSLPQEMHEEKIDLSFGISQPGDWCEPSEAIRSADKDMYRSKHSD